MGKLHEYLEQTTALLDLNMFKLINGSSSLLQSQIKHMPGSRVENEVMFCSKIASG